MKINIKLLPVYYLNIDSREKQRKHIEEDLTNYGFSFTRVTGIKYPNNSVSACLGYVKSIYNHILSNKEFKPFILLEDDATIKEGSDFDIEYPEDCDCIYIGMSGAADPNSYYDGGGLILRRSKEFPRLYRIYNSLSGHAILFLNLRYTLAYLMSLIETTTVSEVYYPSRCADIYAVRLFPFFNVYALEIPIFYQSKDVEGNEIATDISLKGERDTILTNEDLKKLYKARIYTQLIFQD